jgi:hypothetical protein
MAKFGPFVFRQYRRDTIILKNTVILSAAMNLAETATHARFFAALRMTTTP